MGRCTERQQSSTQPLRTPSPAWGGSQVSSLPSKEKQESSLVFRAWGHGEMGDTGALAALPPRSMAASANPGLEAGVLICHAQALKHWAEALAGIFVPHPLNAAPAPGLSSYVPSLNIPLQTRSLSQPKEDWWVTQEGGTPPPAALCPHGSSAPLATLQEALFFRGWV